MPGSGDYTGFQRLFKKAVADKTVAAADTVTFTALALLANYTLFIQWITVSVITDAAQTLTFQDNAGTPIIIAKTKASPGLGTISIDFGSTGYALTEGKQLDVVISAAGLAAKIHVEGYYKQTATINAQTAPGVGISPLGLN